MDQGRVCLGEDLMTPTEPPRRQPPWERPEERPLDRLLELHRAGKLSAGYPEIAPLMVQLPDDRLRHAGQLLARLDPDEVLRHHPATPVVTVAITGHGTLSALVPALAAELARHGLLPRTHVADFDGYVQDLSDPSRPLHTVGADLVLCVLDPMVILDELPTPWRLPDAEQVLEEKLRLIEDLVERFSSLSRATLVLNTLPLPRRVTAQLVDHRSRALLGAAWRDANARLLRLAALHPALIVLDLDPLIGEGIAAADLRMSLYTKSHLSDALLAGYAREVGHLARHLTGRTKKTLVLDLDGTVWGGVLGEDGPDGIEVADSYRGEAFRAFQRTVKQLGSQGVLLAAVSKNDPEPVRRVLAEHPEMTLREDDFVRVTASWRPKPDNLRETAEALNLDVGSFVFLDDSDFECWLVRRELPPVATVPLDDEPALHVERLLRDGWFDVREVSAEDRARTSLYREESARGDFLRTFDSIDDYLRQLRVRVQFGAVSDREVGRVSQLTLRTNQFNLTTVRLQPRDVESLAADPGARVLTIHSGDRFGDNGLVGTVFLRQVGTVAHLDNFLLSCRVFSRGIEQACLAEILRWARSEGLAAVEGAYHPTAKNAGVADFYPRHGFRERVSGPGAAPDHRVFRHDLAEIPAPPDHVDLISRL
jgi:FkbH-like protein